MGRNRKKQTSQQIGQTESQAIEQREASQPNEVTQGTLHLNPFDADVPAITLADGTEYVPIRALCELLGLAPSPWIAVVCGYYRGDDVEGAAVRRLPYLRPDGVSRDEWCLDRYHVLRWLTFHLNPHHVPAGVRHEQLLGFQRQMVDVVGRLYQHQQEDFHAVKQDVIHRLDACATSLRTLDELIAAFGPHLEHSVPTEAEGRAIRVEFVAFVAEGRRVQEQLADALRAVLQQMTDELVIDAVKVDEATGEVVDTVAMPILPHVPDLSEVNRLSDKAHQWFVEDLVAWPHAHGINATFHRSDAETEDE